MLGLLSPVKIGRPVQLQFAEPRGNQLHPTPSDHLPRPPSHGPHRAGRGQGPRARTAVRAGPAPAANQATRPARQAPAELVAVSESPQAQQYRTGGRRVPLRRRGSSPIRRYARTPSNTPSFGRAESWPSHAQASRRPPAQVRGEAATRLAVVDSACRGPKGRPALGPSSTAAASRTAPRARSSLPSVRRGTTPPPPTLISPLAVRA